MINGKALMLVCEELLKEKKAVYRKMNEEEILQGPSSRLRTEGYVISGSQSNFNHVIFLSEGSRNGLLLASYSKVLVFPSSDHERLSLKALDINAQTSLESSALWRTETKHGNVYPVLEMTVFPTGQGFNKEFIWKCCGNIDKVFKNWANEFNGGMVSNSGEAAKKVKDFLQNEGFKKIRESPIQGGVSYLVVLSLDGEQEDLRWKKFPMKIDVSELLTFRVYFSLNNAVVTASKGFISCCRLFIAECNSRFPIGFYNYVSRTNQLQFTLKLHYQALSAPDLFFSLYSYYQSTIRNYQRTVRAIVELHAKTNTEMKPVCNMLDYVVLLHEKLQGEYVWMKSEYTQGDLECLKTLDKDREVEKYFLPKPFYWYKPDSNKLYVKTRRRLYPIRTLFDQYSTSRDDLCMSLIELLVYLTKLRIYPTASMLFCTNESPCRVIIIPQSGFHRQLNPLLRSLASISSHHFNFLKSSRDLTALTTAKTLNVSFENFLVQRTALYETFLLKNRTNEGDLLLYEIRKEVKTLRFAVLLEWYRKEVDTLQEYPNALLGWTECNEEDARVHFALNDGISAPLCFLCEKLEFKLWENNQHIAKLLETISKLQSLHSARLFHWFLSPLTVRQHRSSGKVALVLPGMTEAYVKLIYAMLPKKSREYIAPEVREFLKKGKKVENREKADVYSMCKLIQQCLKNFIQQSSQPPSLLSLITHGQSSNPIIRPTLGQLSLALQALKMSQEC